MCQANKSSSVVISLIAAFVFGLVIAVFAKSAAAYQLKPENVDNSRINITNYNEQVEFFCSYAETELKLVSFNTGADGPEAVSSLPLLERHRLPQV